MRRGEVWLINLDPDDDGLLAMVHHEEATHDQSIW